MKVRFGLVDSGLPDRHSAVAGYRFTSADRGPVQPDRLGHGSVICDIVKHHAPDILIYNAQVFDERGVTTAAVVAAAIDWLTDKKVDVINLSLGMRQNRPVLEAACGRALAAGIAVIAAAPARGAKTYPSAYGGIIRATGDARCDVGEVSFLDSPQADFGGCPRGIGSGPDAPLRVGGASMGTAHISGQVAAYLRAGGDKNMVREWLVSRAEYRHNERRTE